MKYHVNEKRAIGKRSPMLYGHFIEHFHRQIYDGIYDPGNELSDEEGFRKDIIEAMKKIKVPVLRWPGGCFVSSYHWKDGVGENRQPFFDKAWRVEDPNTFGTDEYIHMCRKIACEPYICTNAGTGTAEEMSDWVEYCNLENEGKYAKWRIANGEEQPYNVKYWSIGNENYGNWEIGAKSSEEWWRLVKESAKMIKHVSPTVELSAAALPDIDWTMNLLKHCGEYLDWISLHGYWDMLAEKNELADYTQCMAYTEQVDRAVTDVKGLLTALHLEKKIKIAFDEWNLRGWHHPNVHTIKQGIDKDSYLIPRDKNDDNSSYTMADAVFTACFLNAMNRNCDIVGMANFAPILNTRGCIYSYKDGVVLRSTYHVFDLYVNHMGDTVLDSWEEGEKNTFAVLDKNGRKVTVNTLDILATQHSETEKISIAVVNKEPDKEKKLEICLDENSYARYEVQEYRIVGSSVDSYNDIDRTEVFIEQLPTKETSGVYQVNLAPHSINVIDFKVL